MIRALLISLLFLSGIAHGQSGILGVNVGSAPLYIGGSPLMVGGETQVMAPADGTQKQLNSVSADTPAGYYGNTNKALGVLAFGPASTVTTDGYVRKIKFSLSQIPPDLAAFSITVWRKYGTTYNWVGTQSIRLQGLVVGKNTVTVTSPFWVKVGDQVSFGYDTEMHYTFFGYAVGAIAAGNNYSYYLQPNPKQFTGVDWDGGLPSAAYPLIELWQ